jgi:hypothetical protein
MSELDKTVSFFFVLAVVVVLAVLQLTGVVDLFAWARYL